MERHQRIPRANVYVTFQDVDIGHLGAAGNGVSLSAKGETNDRLLKRVRHRVEFVPVRLERQSRNGLAPYGDASIATAIERFQKPDVECGQEIAVLDEAFSDDVQ